MNEGLRFVDSDMHVVEPPDLFDRYLTQRSSPASAARWAPTGAVPPDSAAWTVSVSASAT
jgi:hypothetical protein